MSMKDKFDAVGSCRTLMPLCPCATCENHVFGCCVNKWPRKCNTTTECSNYKPEQKRGGDADV